MLLMNHPDDWLTERECEVVQQVVRGLTNKVIAETLVITVKTVESHLTHIYSKLGLDKRCG